jgi:hypothetical protein
MFAFTHKELVEVAYRWLVKNGGVGVAFKELKSTADEIPDVIGFDSCQSILIEVKVSRSDFLQDKHKPHRAKGMGNWRFFCCPKGLIKQSELPEKWGLIYIDENGKSRVEYDCRKKKVRMECTSDWARKEYPEGFWWRTTRAEENYFEADLEAEQRIMYTALRRLFIKGYVKHIYDKDYNSSTNADDLIQLNEPPCNP